jgi:hypothetical protein
LDRSQASAALTEAGYVGEDVENIILKLLQSADYYNPKGEHHVDNLQESCAYLRGSCGCCGAVRNARIGRTFGNIRHRVVCRPSTSRRWSAGHSAQRSRGPSAHNTAGETSSLLIVAGCSSPGTGCIAAFAVNSDKAE